MNRFEIYPPPSTTDTLTFDYLAKGIDLSNDDYTAGTITTLANGDTSVTGSGTSWTSSMVGRYFKINDNGQWYKISAVGSTTTLTLASEYQGSSISGGSENYTIGEMPITPEETHILPVYFALWKYFLFRKDRMMAREYRREWLNGKAEAITDYVNEEDSEVLYNDRAVTKRGVINPNYYPENMT